MFLVSGPELVIAACRAGVVGTFPAPNARTPTDLDEWLATIRETVGNDADAAPWAVNLVMHRSYDRMQEDLQVTLRHQPPLVITALGSPKEAVETVHSYGGMVWADVNSVAFAHKAAATGVDGLVLVCSGAGGHTGATSAFAFVNEVRSFWKGTLVLAGGIASGQAIRAAEVLGADLAYLGTAFIATEESRAVAEYKQMVVGASAEDIVCSDALTGVPANWLAPSLREAGYDPANMPPRRDINFGEVQQGNKAWKNVWSAGQAVGGVGAVEPAQAIVDRLYEEYRQAAALPAWGSE